MTEEITAGVAFPVRYGRCVSRFSKRAAVSACLRRARLSERGVAVGHFTGETLSRAEAMRRRTVDSSKSTLVFRNAWRLDASVGRRSPWLWVNSSRGTALPASVEFVCVDGERCAPYGEWRLAKSCLHTIPGDTSGLHNQKTLFFVPVWEAPPVAVPTVAVAVTFGMKPSNS